MRIRDLPGHPGVPDQSDEPAAANKRKIICYAIETEIVDNRYRIKSRSETGAIWRSQGLFDLPFSGLKEFFIDTLGLKPNSFNLIMNVGERTVTAVDLEGIALYEMKEAAP